MTQGVRTPRARALTEADVEAIVDAFDRSRENCRCDVDPKDVEDAVAFFRLFREAMNDSKKTVRRWFLIFFMALIVTLIGAGILSKLKGGA